MSRSEYLRRRDQRELDSLRSLAQEIGEAILDRSKGMAPSDLPTIRFAAAELIERPSYSALRFNQ